MNLTYLHRFTDPSWIDELRGDFVAHAPAGPLVHRPRARHLVARR
jgi:hypothetical protein